MFITYQPTIPMGRTVTMKKKKKIFQRRPADPFPTTDSLLKFLPVLWINISLDLKGLLIQILQLQNLTFFSTV